MTAAMFRVTALTVLVSAVTAQRAVWIVDPANGPGANFTNLQQAADSASVSPGDVLQLLPGFLGPLQTSKPLVLLGSAQSTLGHVSLSAIPAGSEFVIDGCRVDFQLGYLAFIEAWSCPGRVVIARLAYSASLPFPQDTMLLVVGAADCDDLELEGITPLGLNVLMARCKATVRNCTFREHYVNPPISGFDALVAHQCELEVVDCYLQGSNGGLSTGIGLRVVDGTVRVRATAVGTAVIRGGPIGSGNFGTALSIIRTQVEIDPQVSVGTVINQGGTLTTRSLPAVSASWSGGTATASVFADPGSVALVGFGFAQAPGAYAAGAALRLDLQFGIAGLALAVLPASRMLTTTASLPNATAFLGARFAAQGATLVLGQVELANAAALVVR